MFRSAAPQTTPVQAAVPELDGKVLVSRQPVLDRFERVTGYRIAYAVPDGEPLAPAEGPEAMALFDTVLSVIGLERLVGETPAQLPISREMLQTLGTPPIRPDRLLLRIRYEDATDPSLEPMLEATAQRGYTLELDGVPGPGFDLALLDRFAVVEIDPAGWEEAELQVLLTEILARHRIPLAVNLPDHAAREHAEALGFGWFTGAFFGAPKVIKGRNIPTGDIRTLASVIQLQGEEISLEDVVEVINRDLGLSVKLLRYINSAYFGMRAKVNSIRDAALRLGSYGVARWALTITVSSAPDISPEVAVMALTRARLCETLAAGRDDVDAGEMFTVGLLSAVDGVFNRPLETIIPELPLTDRVADALLHHAGPSGEILKAALAYERGDFGNSLLERIGRGHGRSYRNALSWARETLVETA